MIWKKIWDAPSGRTNLLWTAATRSSKPALRVDASSGKWLAA